MLNPNAFQNLCGNYHFARYSAVNDTTLIDVASQAERTLRKNLPFCSEAALEHKLNEDENLLATVKYDGEGTYLYYEENDNPDLKKPEIFLFNPSSGRVRVGLPCLEQAAFRLKSTGIKKLLTRVELYLPALENRRRTIFDVTSASASSGIERVKEFKIATISIQMIDRENWMEKDIIEIWEKMGELFGTDTNTGCHRVHGVFCTNKELKPIYDEIVKNEEGMVIHSLSRKESFKVKPQKTLDAAVIGYVEDEFEGQFGIRSILTALTYEEGGHQKFFHSFCRVYSGMTDQEAVELLPQLQALKVDSPIQMTDNKGRIIQFVKPELILQAQGEDITTTKRDEPNKAQLFEWKEGKWEFRGLSTAPRLTFATYQGIRTDKILSEGGARMAQAIDSPVLPNIQTGEIKTPKIIIQKSWIKHLKSGEQTGLKKVTLVENNRENYIPYTIIYTDYSHKRKEPLKVTTQYAKTQTRANELYEKWKNSLTKGWEEIKKEEA